MVLGFFGRVLGYFITLPSRNVNGSVASKANLRRLKILSGFGDLIYVICVRTLDSKTLRTSLKKGFLKSWHYPIGITPHDH